MLSDHPFEFFHKGKEGRTYRIMVMLNVCYCITLATAVRGSISHAHAHEKRCAKIHVGPRTMTKSTTMMNSAVLTRPAAVVLISSAIIRHAGAHLFLFFMSCRVWWIFPLIFQGRHGPRTQYPASFTVYRLHKYYMIGNNVDWALIDAHDCNSNELRFWLYDIARKFF